MLAKSLLEHLWNCEYWAREPYEAALKEWAQGIENPGVRARELEVEASDLQAKVIQLDDLCESGIWDADLRVLFENAFREHLFKLDQRRHLEDCHVTKQACVGTIGA